MISTSPPKSAVGSVLWEIASGNRGTLTRAEARALAEQLSACDEPDGSLTSTRDCNGATARAKRTKRRLYLDLDGVMADFDRHFPETFGLDHRSLADDAMWERINGHPSYFRDMPPCEGALPFFRSVEHLDPIILTACPKSNYGHVARQKREWVREHLADDLVVLPVMGGRNKGLFMHRAGDILVDDFPANIKAWATEGGIGILHRAFDTTAQDLAVALSFEDEAR